MNCSKKTYLKYESHGLKLCPFKDYTLNTTHLMTLNVLGFQATSLFL